MKLSSTHTKLASYVGYLTQALTINFAPLLFITFVNTYNISITKISLLIAISFFTQLMTDSFEAKFGSKLNMRATVVLAHIIAILGITGYAYLPDIMPTPFSGLVICVILSAIGAGIVEVVISPIVEACPTGGKSAAMSLLHSFYSWGQAGVVILSTIFFKFVGIEHWRILACLWAIIPAIGALAFCFVPIYTLAADKKSTSSNVKQASPFRSGTFVIFFLLMICSGASEMAISQWASTFAESGLGVSKAVGDILGPCCFAILMGVARVGYAKISDRIDLRKFILYSAMLCIISYLIAALSPNPVISLFGCALCGLSVGIMWPGTYSLATKTVPNMGLTAFAILAIGGDLGCMIGPAAAGFIAGLFNDNLKISFLLSAAFPITMLIILISYSKLKRND